MTFVTLFDAIFLLEMTTDETAARWVAALGKSSLFREMSEAELLPLVSRAKEIRVDSGAPVFFAGEPSRALFLVLSGRTRAVRQSPDGREQIIHEDEAGSTFPDVAVWDGGPYPSTVVAVEDSILLEIPRSDVLRFLLVHPMVAVNALRVLSARLRRATGMVEDFALRDVSQRLSEFLLRERPAAEREFLLNYSNQEIADSIGTVREVVSRTFAKLQKRGWLKRDGRRVRLLDEEALRRHAEAD